MANAFNIKNAKILVMEDIIDIYHIITYIIILENLDNKTIS